MASGRGAVDARALSARLFRVTERVRNDFSAVTSARGLTPQQARTLLALEQPRPMRALAHHLACDASNVTGLADRLEELGLVERVAGQDRRVKMLQLTDSGRRARSELVRDLGSGSTFVRRLDAAERAQLAVLLDKLLDDEPLP